MRCGEIFDNCFTANLLENLEFWKAVNIWQNCGHEFGMQFLWPTLYNAMRRYQEYNAAVLLIENRYLEDLKSHTGGATTRAR